MDNRKEGYRFFQNCECEYFPCHKTDDPENFNCLFCYCPLYALGKGCGGNFRYVEGGVKDCTNCRIPHERENYRRIISRYGEILEMVRERDGRRES